MKDKPPTRREFLEQAGAGSLAAVAMSALPQSALQARERTERMKITRIEAVTFRKDLHIGGGSGSKDDGAEFMWVRLHTDKAIIGTGETYPWETARLARSRIIQGTSD